VIPVAELSDELKREVVLMLARFKKPADVVRELRETHEVEATIRQIMVYDAAGGYFEAGDEYRQIFDVARETYLHNVAVVPIAQQAFRLNALMDIFEKAMKRSNLVLASSTLEQAAKDAGGAFSNIRVNLGDLAALSPDERRMQLAQLIDKSLGHDKRQTAPTSDSAQ
jgi:hypothetical protein